MDGFYERAGARLGGFLAEVGVDHSDYALIVGLTEERLQEIIEARGEQLSVAELKQICERSMLSADYIFGLQDHPYPFEPTDENFQRLRDKIHKLIDTSKE